MTFDVALWIAFKTALVCLAIIGAFTIGTGLVIWRHELRTTDDDPLARSRRR